jgi:hypothetical protein
MATFYKNKKVYASKRSVPAPKALLVPGGRQGSGGVVLLGQQATGQQAALPQAQVRSLGRGPLGRGQSKKKLKKKRIQERKSSEKTYWCGEQKTNNTFS